MKNYDDLRWKISSTMAGMSNSDFVALLFSAIPREHLEEIERRKNSLKAESHV